MVRPSNHRLRNAKYGKAPSENGTLARVPKGNGTFLFTTNGSTTNNGGPSKFGMFPNVGTSLGFRNRFSTLSMNYLTTPASLTRPAPAPPAPLFKPIPVGSTAVFEFTNSDDYGINNLLPSGAVANSFANQAATTAWFDLFDTDSANAEVEISSGAGGGTSEINKSVTSVVPVQIIFFQNDAPTTDHPNMSLIIYDNNGNSKYTVNIKQMSDNTSTATVIYDEEHALSPGYNLIATDAGVPFNRPDLLTAQGYHPPPVGVNGYFNSADSGTDFGDPAYQDPTNTGINYYSSNPGTGLPPQANFMLPVSFADNSNPALPVEQPLIITVTKSS